MAKAKLLYLILVISLAVFSVLYIDSIAVIMLICTLLIPVFLVAGLLWLRGTAEAELISGCGSCRSEESIPVTILVHSRCPFSFPRAEAELHVRHGFCKKPEVVRLNFPLQSDNVTRLTFYVRAEYCGIVSIRLARVRVYDVFRIFRTKLRCEPDTFSVLVLPEPLTLPLVNAAAPVERPESSSFAAKPGDDPSEIFGIREYRPGDQVSRMHWKLSSRSDTMLVKEFSAPIQKNILLFIEIQPQRTVRSAEVTLQFCFSAAQQIMQAGHLCELAWYDGRKGKVLFSEPHTTEELTKTFGELYESYFSMGHPEEALREAFGGRRFSSAIVLSNAPTQELLALTEHALAANQKNMLAFCEQAPDLRPLTTELVHILPAEPELRQLLI